MSLLLLTHLNRRCHRAGAAVLVGGAVLALPLAALRRHHL